MFHAKLSRIFFYLFLVSLPFQTRLLFNAQEAYVSWYFNYHLAIFLYLSDIFFLLCFISSISDYKSQYLSTIRLFWKNRLILALFLGMAGLLLSLFHVERIYLSLFEAAKWLEILLIILYIYVAFKERDYWVTFAILMISGCLQAILGLAQFHMQRMLGLTWLGEFIAPMGTPGLATIDAFSGKVIRAYGTMPHPNILGAFLLLGLSCGLVIVSRATKSWHKWVIVLGLIITQIGIFLTFSRIAWLGSVIAWISFGIYWLAYDRKLLIKLLLAIIVSCVTIGTVYSPYLKSRVNESTDSHSVVDRKMFNQFGIDLFKQHPIFGVGAGNYIPALMNERQLEPWQYQPPHNIFIFIAAELGVAGLALFIWILFEIFRRAINNFREPIYFTVYVLLFIFLFMGQFDHYFVTIQQGRLMFALAIGLISALPKLKNNHENI